MNLLVRVDSNAEIGTGHMMRCLALVQAWTQRGGRAFFLATAISDALKGRLVEEEMEILNIPSQLKDDDDVQMLIEEAKRVDANWIVVDGYRFGADYQKRIKDAGYHLLFMDDYGHAGQYVADVVLNQNISASEALYVERAADTRLLLGSRYVLLRKEFKVWHMPRKQVAEVANKILVTMGGGDPANATLKVVRALKSIRGDSLEVKVVIGHCNNHFNTVDRELRTADFTSELLCEVDDMPGLMAWADLAITAGGSTNWEMAFMGLPNVILVTADNQSSIAENLNSEGISINLGWHENVAQGDISAVVEGIIGDVQLRSDMSAKGRVLIDGLGPDRIISTMLGEGLTLREVGEKDAELLFRWVNDPDVRRESFNSEPILIEGHAQWFNAKVHDPDCTFFIALDGYGTPVGQIRFDCQGEDALADVSVAKEQRGRGYGMEIIRAGVDNLLKRRKIENVQAFVKADNKASIKAFSVAGFTQDGISDVGGCKSVRMLWRADG